MRYFSILILFCIQISYCQDKKGKNSLEFEPEFRINAIIPMNFGNNYLAKANNANVGIGSSLSFAKYNNFRLGGGFGYIYYSITDITKAGNINSSRYSTLYGNLSYEIPVTKKISLQPYLGLGSSNINLKSGKRSFGHQDGIDFRIGLYADYRLGNTFSAFWGIGYVQSKFDINTTPEFVSFYDNAKLLQINFGLKLD